MKLSSYRCRYAIKPLIKLVADNISFMEFYLFLISCQHFMYLEILDSKLSTAPHLKGCCNMKYTRNIEELPSLKEIYFDFVCISQDTFSNLIHNCPSIVELTLIDCSSLNSILVPPHLNQHKKLHINCGIRYRQTIKINARNVRVFRLFSSSLKSLKIDLSLILRYMSWMWISQPSPMDFLKSCH